MPWKRENKSNYINYINFDESIINVIIKYQEKRFKIKFTEILSKLM